jgi:nucleotide-binding universal stress UspA family protein
MKPIVLATDGSPSAAKATSLAIELARETGTRLYVVAAWQTPLTIYSTSPMMAGDDLDASEIEQATEAARAAVDLAQADGVDAKSFVRNGEPAEMISQTAENCDASLIVVGSHGWGPIRRLVFGSVSTALLHHAPCPVLVVRFAKETGPPASAEKTRALVAVR